jgi:hypothetical protein
MGEHHAQILISCFEKKAKIIIGQRKKSKQKWAGKEKGKKWGRSLNLKEKIEYSIFPKG